MKRQSEGITKVLGWSGLEPSLPGPGPGVLPLDDSPVARGPKKIGQKIREYNRSNTSVAFVYPLPRLASLFNQKYQSMTQKGQLPKYQPAKGGAAGILLASPIRGRGYNILTDNADETPSPLTAPYETALLEAPLTLAESIVEVAP